MAIFNADTLRTNNPDFTSGLANGKGTGYPIVYANEIGGVRSVQTLEDLDKIPDNVLSKSGDNTDNDAIGLVWYVISEDETYLLKTWEPREWKIFKNFKELNEKFETNITEINDKFDLTNDSLNDIFKELIRIVNYTNFCTIYGVSNSSFNIKLSNGEVITILPIDGEFELDIELGNDISYMFEESSVTELDLSEWNTSKVTNMGYMFNKCSALTFLNLTNWDTSNIINTQYMFNKCSNLISIDLSNWNISSIATFKNMFAECTSLNRIKCKTSFRNWCWANQDELNLPDQMKEGGSGIWELVD